MALINGKGSLLAGLALGVGVAVVGRNLFPAIREAGRPLAKAALKSGWLFFEKTRETLAELAEGAEDMVAEVQAEVEAETEAPVAAAAVTKAAAPEAAAPRKSGTTGKKRTAKKRAP
jgi:uncharacterized protein (DUF1697 family)